MIYIFLTVSGIDLDLFIFKSEEDRSGFIYFQL